LIAAWVSSKTPPLFWKLPPTKASGGRAEGGPRGLNVLKSVGRHPRTPARAKATEGRRSKRGFVTGCRRHERIHHRSRSKDGRYRLADIIVQEGVGLVSIRACR